MTTTIIAILPSRETVLTALDQLNELSLLELTKAAVIAKAESGETILVDDQIQLADGRNSGMRLGALMTALGVVQLGAIALPGIGALIAIGTGAIFGGILGGATGQMAAALIRFGFQHDQIQIFSDSLKNGEIALFLQFEERDSKPQIHSVLAKLGAVVLETDKAAPSSSADFTRLPID